MRFMCLIYTEPGTFEKKSAQEKQDIHAGHLAFQEEVIKRGILVDGAPLDEPSAAKSIRGSNGKAVVTDGPFAETKEILGGYYVLNCKDYDEATAFARQISNIGGTPVEVRRILEISEVVAR